MRRTIEKTAVIRGLGLALVAGLVWTACAEQPDVTSPDSPNVDVPAPALDLRNLDPRIRMQELAPAVLAHQRHGERVMQRPGVVATGVGLTELGRPALRVYVTGDAPARIPQTFDDVPVILVETGPIVARQESRQEAPRAPGGNGRGGKPKGGSDPTSRFDRPVPIGISTGHPDITAGTIAMRVKKGGNVYALSNNHVYADENQASMGDGVLQPGSFDGGSMPGDVIGTLSAYKTIVFSTNANNEIDAAIALTTTNDLGNATPSGGYGVPRSTTLAAVPGMKVLKFGRTTGETNGTVDAIGATVNVGYSTGTARFVNQVIICCGTFSSGGDSGSLILVRDKKGKRTGPDHLKPTALLYAGSQTVTVGNPIDAVLTYFGVTIDGN